MCWILLASWEFHRSFGKLGAVGFNGADELLDCQIGLMIFAGPQFPGIVLYLRKPSV